MATVYKMAKSEGGKWRRCRASEVGTWFLDYRDQWSRRRREATTATTKGEAEKLLLQKRSAITRAEIAGVGNPDAISMTYEKFVEEVFLPHVRVTRRTRTYELYMGYAEATIPAFGAMKLRAIQQGDVQRFLDKLTEQGWKRDEKRPLAAATINRHREFLRCAFYEAQRRKFVSENPVVGTRRLREDNERRRTALPWEEKALLKAATEWFQPMIQTALLSGLRLGELADLRWEAIDRERQVIRIGQGSKGHRHREVPITPDLVAIFDALLEKPFVGPDGPSPFVFYDPDTGRTFSKNRIEWFWKMTLRRAGVKNLHFHDLRRSFASRLAQKGVSLQTIAELLGHSATYVTERYAYLRPEDLREAVALLSGGEDGRNPADGSTSATATG
ncbi:MAG: site-specific integrase [Planctomycetes bacterium]|nr:site-specific integrase [Planctomycetota bacterium]